MDKGKPAGRLRFASCTRLATLALGVMALHSSGNAATVTFGNDVYLGNSATGAINSTTVQRLQRFQAPYNLTVDRLHFQYNSTAGSSTQIFGLQADNGSGLPSGVDLATATINAATPTAGYTANLSSAVSLTAGQTYHLVNRSPNANSTNSATWRLLGNATVGSTVNRLTPDGVPTANVATASSTNSGTTWSTPNGIQTSIWALSNSSTNQIIGQPYSTIQVTAFGGDSPTSGNRIWAGQRFKYTGDSGKLESLAIQVRGLGGTLTDDVRVHLVSVASQGLDQVTPIDPFITTVVPGASLGSGVLLTSGTTPALSPGALYSMTFPIASQPSLVQGNSYMLLLETASGGVMQLSYNQGTDAGVGAAFKQGNFQNTDDGFVVTSAEPLDGNGLPSRLFTSDLFNSSTNVTTYRDARFILTVVPEPGSVVGITAIAGALMMRRRTF